jgi:hypothetical protein
MNAQGREDSALACRDRECLAARVESGTDRDDPLDARGAGAGHDLLGRPGARVEVRVSVR